MKFFSKMSSRVYIAITLIITVPMLIFSYIYAIETKENLYKEKELALLDMATMLDKKLILSYNEVINQSAKPLLTNNEIVETLNKYYQPIINQFLVEFPDIGVGLLHKDLNRIVASGPKFNQEVTKINLQNHNFTSYETGRYEVAFHNASSFFEGKPAINIIYPLSRNGEIIGLISTSTRIEDIEREFYYKLLKNFTITFAIWSTTLTIVFWVFRKYSLGLSKLAKKVKQQDDNTNDFKQYPELLPILETIISSRKEIIHQSNLLKRMIEHFPGGFIAIDKNMKVTFANEPAKEILKVKNLVNHDFIDILINKGISIEKPYILKSLKQGKVFVKQKVKLEGRTIQVDSSPLKEPTTNKIFGAISYFFDVTEEVNEHSEKQKLLEQYFNHTQNLQQLIDSIPIAFLAIDINGKLIAFNDKTKKIFNINSEIPSNKDQNIGNLLHHLNVPKEKHAIYRALKGEVIQNEHFRMFDFDLIVNAYPIKCNTYGRIIGAIAMYQDVTELEILRNEMENMERLNLVGQMAASITHEIRNPMATVRGFIQLLKERSQEELWDYFNIILDEMDRANEIISDFLSLSQNRLVEMNEGNLNKIIRGIFPIIMADTNIKGQYVELDLDEEVPDFKLNKKEIKQLLLNLARNATDAMGQGGKLTISTHVLDGGVVELRISDTGIGIKKEQIDKLFQPFFTTKDGGTGLGLTVSKSIVEKHNGKISIFTEEGKGTIFSIQFKTE